MTISHIEIRQASVADVDIAAPLFDAYRVFYGRESDIGLARRFLQDRLQHGESVLFLALQRSVRAVGFTQLYSSFSSVAAGPVFILNDLFVAPEARRSGIAAGLLDAAAHHGRTAGALRLSLSTATTNTPAQALYTSKGWVRETGFYAYDLTL